MSEIKEIEPKKVTIVTGYYNREGHVDNSIQSLLDQDYDDYNIIIFDDASTDSTYEKLKKFAEKDKRINLIRHSENIGFAKGLINALKMVTSDYVAIHGSGDISEPTRISKQAGILDKFSDVGVVGCTVSNIRLDKDKNILHENTSFTKKFHGSFKKDILHITPFTHGEVMFRKKTYNKVGGYRPQFKFALDRDLWCRMSRECNFYSIPEKLYTRFLLPDGVGTKFDKSFVQRLLSEFARQCHEEVLDGRQDYIERFGDQGLFFLKFNKRMSREFVTICHKRSKYGHFKDAEYISRFLFSRTKNYYSAKAYLKYVVFKSLLKKRYKHHLHH